MGFDWDEVGSLMRDPDNAIAASYIDDYFVAKDLGCGFFSQEHRNGRWREALRMISSTISEKFRFQCPWAGAE